MDTDVLDEEATEQVTQEAVAEEEAASEAALEAKVAGGMKKAFASEVSDAENSDAPDGEDKPDSDEADETEDQSETDDGKDGTEEQTDEDEEAVAAKAAPTLPESYIRSLKAYGWTDDEIDANLKSMGASFIATAAKIHGNRNTEMAAWAAAGRAAREKGQAPVNDGSSPVHPALQGLKPIDAAQLKEKYGEDELVEAVVGPVNATIAAINAVLPQLMQGQQAVQDARMQALDRQIGEFFGGDAMKPFASFYGDGTAEFTPEQLTQRNKVLETADALLFGAKAQGRNLTTEEALVSAHDLVSGEFRTETVRAGIKKETKARSQSMLQRPNSRGKKPSGGRPRTEREMESKVGRKLAEVFGG